MIQRSPLNCHPGHPTLGGSGKINIMKAARALALLVIPALPLAAQDGPSITITPNETRQTITMMGGDMERSSMFLVEAGDPEQVANWSFKDIAFNVCRVQYDKHQELSEGEPDFPWYDRQVAAMKLVQKANPEIHFFATLRSDYHGYKMGDHNNFPTWVWNPESDKFNAEKWGAFLADYVIHMHRAGVPIRHLSTGKEITQTIDAELAVATAKAMVKKLDAANVPRPLLVDPGAWSLPQATEFIHQVEELGAQKMFHAYATHNYRKHGESDWSEFCLAAKHAGAEAWNAESSLGGDDIGDADPPFAAAVDNMARRIQQYRAGINGEIFFEIWSRGISRESRAIWFEKGAPAKRKRSYYLMQAWTNSVIDRTVVDTSGGTPHAIEALAFRKRNQLSLWLVNNDSAQTFSVPVVIRNSGPAMPVSLTRWTADSPTTGTQSQWTPGDRKQLTITLPPQSITFATATLTE